MIVLKKNIIKEREHFIPHSHNKGTLQNVLQLDRKKYIKMMIKNNSIKERTFHSTFLPIKVHCKVTFIQLEEQR